LACRALGDRKTHQSVELLEKALNEDPFFGVRIAAARSLGKHESDEAFEALEKSWQSQDDARVRLAVVERLVGRFDERTPNLIVEILKSEANPSIQAAAVRALGRFHGEPSRQQIIQYLKTDSFRNELAVAAISAMRQQNDPAFKDSLMNVLKKREKQFTSRGLGQGLGTLAHVAQSQDHKDDVREFLLAYVNHPMTTIRTSAIGALGTLGDPKAISVLEAFSSSNEEPISRAAEQAIGKLRESKPIAPRELIELRKELATMKKESEKLEKQLKGIEEQLKAKD
jgi:aminopeptidase N